MGLINSRHERNKERLENKEITRKLKEERIMTKITEFSGDKLIEMLKDFW